jgi:hypothetical protein
MDVSSAAGNGLRALNSRPRSTTSFTPNAGATTNAIGIARGIFPTLGELER